MKVASSRKVVVQSEAAELNTDGATACLVVSPSLGLPQSLVLY